MLGALFGRTKAGGLLVYEALDSEGKLSRDASPHAHKMISNLDFYRPLESARPFFQNWAGHGETVVSLLEDDELREDLNRMQSSELRAAFWTKSSAWWEESKIKLNEHVSAGHFVCGLLDGEGAICSKVYGTYKGLISHQTSSSTNGEHH